MLSKPRDQWTADDRAAATENARRQSRFKHARERVRRISDGAPPLTGEQRGELAGILLPETDPGRVDALDALAERVRRVVDAAPPLSETQLEHLAQMLGLKLTGTEAAERAS